ncbi:MAG: hypothetical protein MJK08_04790 [Campylobacterales bacterium]|nr:hypothetical protein [Campylobacterales bacterium]
MKLIILLFIINILNANEFYYYKNNQKVLLNSVNKITTRTLNYDLDYYKNKDGIILAVNNRLILKLKTNSNLDFYLNEFNMRKIKKISFNTYLLEVKDKSLTLKTSSLLSLKNDVEYSHPDFIKRRYKR